MKRILLWVSILSLIAVLASCSVAANGKAVNISFYSNGEKYSEFSVNSGKAISPVAAPTDKPDGKIQFLFWSLDSDETTATPFDFSAPVNEDTTFYAVWADYSISYRNGDSLIYTDYAVKGRKISAPGINVTAPEGKVFSHWSLTENGNEYAFGSDISSSITLRAVFKDRTFTVRFIDGITDTEKTVVYGSSVAEPIAPSASGRTFRWWSTIENGSEFDFSTKITSDLTLYAVWDVITYAIIFDDGTSQTTQIVAAGEQVKAPANPSGEGRVFRHWSTSKDGSPYDFSSTVNYGFVLYAVWEYEEYTIEFYSDGKPYSSETVRFGDMIPEPSSPSSEGKEFRHWSVQENGSAAFDFKTPADKDLKLYAVFEDIVFTITFNDGAGIHMEKVLYGDTAEEPAMPEIEGKRFLRWSRQQGGAVPYDFNEPVLSSFTLYAVYEDIEFTVTYISGENRTEESVAYGENAVYILPDTPAGKVFSHWSESDGGPAFDFSTEIYEDLILYAVYEDETVIITFDDGTDTSTEELVYGKTPSAPENPVRDGYTFLWWSSTADGEAYDFSKPVYEDLRLYAVWQALTIHVTFMNGSEVYLTEDIERGAAVTMPDNPGTHPANTSEYLFWSLEPGKQGAYDFTSVPEDDIILHAVWMPKGISIDVEGTEVELLEGYRAEGNVQLPYGITVIREHAFDSTIRTGLSSTFEPKITAIEIPSSVREIGTYAFHSCENLTKITLNEGLKTINFNAFAGSGIRSLRVPVSLKRISFHAFAGMDSLTSVYLPEGITSIESEAFSGCDNLYGLEIPTSLEYIDPNAFYHCYKLDCIEYAEGTEVIDTFFIFNDFDISVVIIPTTVKSIESDVFAGCGKVIFQTEMSETQFESIEGFPWGAAIASEVVYE